MPAEQILERLMREYGDSVFRMCYLYLKDYYLAEDATQETFIKAMKSYDSFLHNSNEKTWLIRIAINSCKNIMRTKWFRFPMMNVDDVMVSTYWILSWQITTIIFKGISQQMIKIMQ